MMQSVSVKILQKGIRMLLEMGREGEENIRIENKHVEMEKYVQ